MQICVHLRRNVCLVAASKVAISIKNDCSDYRHYSFIIITNGCDLLAVFLLQQLNQKREKSKKKYRSSNQMTELG